jgi:hypothetical protein
LPRSAASDNLAKVGKLGPYYAKILDEITRHNRVPRQRPATVRLRHAYGGFDQSIAGSYGGPSRSVLSYKVPDLGGAPRFCQENWDFAPPNPWGKGALLALASIRQGDSPAWSDVLNDGDAGTINIYAERRKLPCCSRPEPQGDRRSSIDH